MNNNIHIESVLDEFLKRRITRAEAEVLLEKESVQDADLEINLHLASAKAVQRYNILKQVQSVHYAYLQSQIKNHTPKNIEAGKSASIKMYPIKWALRIAASVILIMGAWFAYQYSRTSADKLYSELYQAYNVNTDRGIGDITTHNMVNEFKAGNYGAVIKTYESLSATNNREKFLAAYACHVTGDYEKASALLNELLINNKKTNNRLYNDEAEFYLALSCLKTKDIRSARLLFERIRENPNHTFHEKVSKWTIRRLKWLQ
ncbi:MAG: hypothetical protein SFU87_19035 [Chitinophagaceae bacterium]|nr:hypothetical protein [Chitinophagaceae bacterium]